MKNLRKLKSWDFARPEKPQFLALWRSSFSQLADKVYLVLMIAHFQSLSDKQPASVAGYLQL